MKKKIEKKILRQFLKIYFGLFFKKQKEKKGRIKK